MGRLNLHVLWPLLCLLLADGLILAGAPPLFRYGAALALLAVLPGWVWLQAAFEPPAGFLARLTLAGGLSLALTILSAMLAVYLPGPLSLTPLLILTNALILGGVLAGWRRQSTAPPAAGPVIHLSLILGLILLLAVALRLPRLGYAEFHEDEAEALMLGVRLLQGEDYALFLHRKGPAQMLLPLAFWLFTGQITEALARFPFALSSILSVVTLYLLGRRWFNRPAGLIAAALWAVNGYSLGFGRMVQYQALIFFLGPLALYGLTLARRQPRFLFLSAILLAVSLLAHFDALLLLPAAGYLVWLALASPAPQKQPQRLPPLSRPRLRLAGLAGLLFLALLASFYVPFVLDPEFQNTTRYLQESRIKPGLLYNNLDLLRRFDQDYSSHFYLPLLGLGLTLFLLNQQPSTKAPSTKARLTFPITNTQSPIPLRPLTITALLLLAASAVWRPGWWSVGSVNLALLPWLLLGLLSFGLSSSSGGRAALLAFGAGLIGYGFLVEDPRTHLYIFYPGAALLAGAGWATVLGWPKLRPFLLGGGALLLGLTAAYGGIIFLATESGFSQLRSQWDGSSWEWVYDDLPQPREYFGYPKREGWKAIGALRAQGQFPGDFRSVNEDFIIPIWYNYGQARSCYETPAHFFVRTTGLEKSLLDISNYGLVGEIEREGETRLQIFQAGAAQIEPKTYRLAPFETEFDRLATPRRFAQQNEPAQPRVTQFGPAIQLRGFDLPERTLAPGQTLRLRLYWRALAQPTRPYRVFVHLTDGSTLWAQQDDDPACRLPTPVWRPGQHSVGQFRLAIDPATPPGRYPLIIGLYDAETLERLPITAGAGVTGDDFLWLGDVEVR